MCADAHKTELQAAGFDPRKTYCDITLGVRSWELCYDPKKLVAKCNNATVCSDGNVCNGIEVCNVTSGVCQQQGPALDCDDNDLCTTDSCDSVPGCIHTPIGCGDYEACDRLTGTCQGIEKFRPCIAVIDESDSNSDFEKVIDERWSSFRFEYPSRPFCLLQPLNPSNSNLYKPPDFLSDPLVTFATVNRDEGDPALASNWLTACNYTNLATSGIDFVGLFVDESGSMTRDTVRASLNKLFVDVSAAGVTYCLVYDESSENWITPFIYDLHSIDTVGGDSFCVVPP